MVILPSVDPSKYYRKKNQKGSKGVLVGVRFILSLLILKVERFVKFGKSCREFCIL